MPKKSLDGTFAADHLVWEVVIHVENDVHPVRAYRFVVDAMDGTGWVDEHLRRDSRTSAARPHRRDYPSAAAAFFAFFDATSRFE